MVANKVLSHIANQKVAISQRATRFDVAIKNKKIFNDLGMVFENISGYRRLFIKLFEDMDKFNFMEAPSVTIGDILDSDYKKIKLYPHTLNTFKEMLIIANKDNFNKEILLLIALLHDFGKSNELCSNYGITKEEKHWVRSSLYFKAIVGSDANLFDLDETTFNIIKNVLEIHHSRIHAEEEKNNKYLLDLKKADSLARLFEKKMLERTA